MRPTPDYVTLPPLLSSPSFSSTFPNLSPSPHPHHPITSHTHIHTQTTTPPCLSVQNKTPFCRGTAYSFPSRPNNISLCQQSFSGATRCVCESVSISSIVSLPLPPPPPTPNPVKLKRSCLCPLCVFLEDCCGQRWVAPWPPLRLRNAVCYAAALHNRYPVSSAGWRRVGGLQARLMRPGDKGGCVRLLLSPGNNSGWHAAQEEECFCVLVSDTLCV